MATCATPGSGLPSGAVDRGQIAHDVDLRPIGNSEVGIEPDASLLVRGRLRPLSQSAPETGHCDAARPQHGLRSQALRIRPDGCGT